MSKRNKYLLGFVCVCVCMYVYVCVLCVAMCVCVCSWSQFCLNIAYSVKNSKFHPTTTLRKLLVHVKDLVPTEMRTGVVYQSGRQDCPATNVGQTERLRAKWIKEHKSALTNGHPERSVVAENAMNTSYHQLEQHSNKAFMPPFWQRCTPETWHWRSQSHPINREEGILFHVYDTHYWEHSHTCTEHHHFKIDFWACVPVCWMHLASLILLHPLTTLVSK